MPRSRQSVGEPRQFGGAIIVPVGLAGLAMISPSSAPTSASSSGCRLVMRVLADRDQHRLDAERRQDVAIGRIAGHGEPDPVAGLESSEKGEQKRGRRAGRDDDLGGIDRNPVLRPVIAGDRLPQRRDAERVGIADPFARRARAEPPLAPVRAPRCRAGRLRDGLHRRPPASRSLAARSTSIAMKGGTSPRRAARKVMPGRTLPV